MYPKPKHRPIARRMVFFLIPIVAIILAGAAVAQAPNQPTLPPLDYTLIPGNPLSILVANDASYQVMHTAAPTPSSPGLVYETSNALADSGIFVHYNQGISHFVIGPDFLNHETSAANLYDPWTPVSQSTVSGTGSHNDPFQVTSVVSHTSGVTMSVLTSYVNGTDEFRLDWEICLESNAALSTFLASDFYLQAGIPETSLGFLDASTGAVGAVNQDSGWAQGLKPITPASHYQAVLASDPDQVDLWDLIGEAGAPGPGFNDTVNAVNANDNGAGLQWNLNATPCASASAVWQVSPPGGGPLPASNFIYLPWVQTN